VSVSARLSVLIVAEYASTSMAGEARLPLHYYRILRSRGVDVHLLVPDRNRDELLTLFPEDADRLHFTADTWLHRLLWAIHQWLPERLSWFTAGTAMRLLTQWIQGRIAHKLIRRHGINLVHLPIPVTPREPLAIYDLGVPVMLGPMNGGMNYPPDWNSRHPVVDLFMQAGQPIAELLNRLIPGKLRSQLILVANQRTRAALPAGLKTPIVQLTENGVDLRIWSGRGRALSGQSVAVPHFVFIGRLIHWKGADMLLDAFAALIKQQPASLTIIGDGREMNNLIAQVTAMGVSWGRDICQSGIANHVTFAGWLSQPACAEVLAQSDSLVLPSLLESGGAVVLEAMAMGLPVIAADWGGPRDYLDSSCGILVPPACRPEMVRDLTIAMAQLAQDPKLRQQLGAAGQALVYEKYDWERKVDRVMDLYDDLVNPRKIMSVKSKAWATIAG
jgi:glycosyltransferase involved in cell wall biosynthesis